MQSQNSGTSEGGRIDIRDIGKSVGAREFKLLESDKCAILLELLNVACDDAEMNDAKRLGRTQARFAILLVKLAQEADIVARRVVCLTWGLLIVTVILLAVTLIDISKH